MMRPARVAAVLLTASVALLVAAPAATAAWGMPDALTSRGQVVEGLFGVILVLGVLTFVLVFVWLVLLVVRFREGTGHGRATQEKERHSLKAEVAWFGLPLIMVLSIGVAAYNGLVTLDHGIPVDQTAMQIRITGSQWNWLADYGSGVQVFANPSPMNGSVAHANAFLVPQDTNILLNITSADVIHAFQVLDANHAYVTFNDANPLGENAHALQTVNFPAGDYFVQCNKMCLNPGHAYMHAAIKAVPKAQFDHWFAGKAAAGTASLVQTLQLASKADGLHWAGNGTLLSGHLDLAAQTRVVVELTDTTAAVTLKAEGVAEKTITAGETKDTFFAFDAAQPGTYTLSGSNGGAVQVVAVQATPIEVDLGNFRFQPNHLDLQLGTTYLVQLKNVHTATHDLTIGHYNGGNNPVGQGSKPVGGGGSGAFIFTPTEKGQFDMWCSQAGHASLGMVGTVTVN